MNYWLIKSEPDEYSIDDLESENCKSGVWKGIRTEQSKDILRDEVSKGDQAFFFHANCLAPGIAGVAEFSSDAYPCPEQYDPSSELYDPRATKVSPLWYAIDIVLVRRFDPIISIPKLKASPALGDLPLLKQSRLAIQTVSPNEWATIVDLPD